MRNAIGRLASIGLLAAPQLATAAPQAAPAPETGFTLLTDLVLLVNTAAAQAMPWSW